VKTRRMNLLLFILLLGLMTFALWSNQGADFAGADAQAEALIAQVDPGYKPWFEPIWEPPSGEIESMFFSIQAALGSGFICFYLGYKAGKKKNLPEVRRGRD